MDFKETSENKMIRDAVREWAAKECSRDLVETWDAEGDIPDKLQRKFSGLGFCGMTVSEASGGEGRNIEGTCIVAGELAARFHPLSRWYIHQVFFGGLLIETLGDPAQKKSLLPKCVGGKYLVAPVGLDDPDRPPLAAEDNGRGEFSLTAEVDYVVLADRARAFLVPCQTPDKKVSLYLVPADREGIIVTPVETIGCRGAEPCHIRFKSSPLSPLDILGGEPGHGTGQWEQVVDLARLGAAAEALGLAKGAFDYTLDYARQRVQFGRAIGRFPALRNWFADAACTLDGLDMMMAKAAWCADRGTSFSREAAAVRLKAGDAAVDCAMHGLQYFGGYGYTMEYDIQRYVRDTAGLSAAADGRTAALEHMGSLLGL